MADTAIFDVDGTLVDTNYQHALAWFRAFRRYGITLPMWRIHRGIGMGGDMFVPEVAGREVEQAHGDDLRKAWVEEFDQLIGEVQPFEGAHELLAEVKERGFRLVLRAGAAAPYMLDDATVAGVVKTFTQTRTDLELYAEQGRRWQALELGATRRRDVERSSCSWPRSCCWSSRSSPWPKS